MTSRRPTFTCGLLLRRHGTAAYDVTYPEDPRGSVDGRVQSSAGDSGFRKRQDDVTG